MANEIRSVGIIGLGSFGAFAASLIPRDITVLGHDPHRTEAPASAEQVSMAEAGAADVVMLAIPLSAYPAVLTALAPVMRPEALIMDVCSVKQRPEALIREYLPEHRNILLTHPLFGPQSASGGVKGHRLIVTHSQGARAQAVTAFCERSLGLEVRPMSGAAHDAAMARVHALTFFVARGLGDLGLGEEELMTPSYQMLLDLVRFDATHSDELFRTIQQGNLEAAAMRHRFIQRLQDIDQALRHRRS